MGSQAHEVPIPTPDITRYGRDALGCDGCHRPCGKRPSWTIGTTVETTFSVSRCYVYVPESAGNIDCSRNPIQLG